MASAADSVGQVQRTLQGVRAYRNLAAEVYHLDKPVGHSFGDVEFYGELLAGATGPIFEPAAGNGRVLIPLALDGHTASAAEPSPDMRRLFEQAAAAAGVDVPVGSGLFTDIDAVEAYEAVIIPAGSIQLLTSPAETRAALTRMHRSLVAGGRLIFDLDALGGLFASSASARSWPTDDGLITLTETIESIDPSTQTRTSQLRYERWVDGLLAESQLEHFILRFWGLHEMCALLELCGFVDVELHGDYRRGAPVTSSTEVTTVVAAKAAATSRA